MATAQIRKSMSDRLLKKLQNHDTKETRKSIKNNPHVIILQDLVWLDLTIAEIMRKQYVPSKKFHTYSTDKKIAQARELAKASSEKFYSQIGQTQFNKLLGRIELDHPPTHKLILEKKAFLVKNFAELSILKVEIINKVLRKGHKQFYEKDTEGNFKKVKKKDATDQSINVQNAVVGRVDRAHGALDQGGAGKAVAQLAIAEGKSAVMSFFGEPDVAALLHDQPRSIKELNNAIDSKVDGMLEDMEITGYEASLIKGVVVDYKKLVNSKTGKITATYIPYIVYQDQYSNSRDAEKERKQKTVMFEFYKELGLEAIANMEGSDSFLTITKKIVARDFIAMGRLKNAKLTLSDNSLKTAIKAGKGRADSKSASSKKSVLTRNSRKMGTPISAREDKKPKRGIASSPLRMIAIINKKLPETIRKNMGDPRLQNRSGRFSNSVQVKDVIKTSRGYSSFGYTYQKNPYQVFEVGAGEAPWANQDRDPRKLIDKSIREIAATIALERFYTRRL